MISTTDHKREVTVTVEQSLSVTRYIAYSFPTPLEELVLHVLARAREMQSSGRFPEYDFENHSGILSIIRDPQFHDLPIHETSRQKLIDFENAIRSRQERYNVRGEAYNNRSHIHLLRANINPIQRSSSSADDVVARSPVSRTNRTSRTTSCPNPNQEHFADAG